jgi:hypothetical protein
MYEPGLDRHEWESEWPTLEDDIRTDPGEALSELDELLARMLDDAGYDVNDPVVRGGEEREIVAEFLAAREITQVYERGSDELSGDVAAAVSGYRALFDYLLGDRRVADGDIELDGEPER